MARKKKSSGGEFKGDEWLATYADTVTLLLTFFVLLYSTATVDSEKTKSISSAFTAMFSGDSGDTLLEYDLYNGAVPLIGGETKYDIEEMGNMSPQAKMYNNVKDFISKNDLQEVVEVIDSEKGIVIQLRDNILFESASSNIREESKVILDKISTLISSVANPILVEGHTDNIPIRTMEFPSNWELSADRAVNVVRYFVESRGQNPSRFSAAGYGEYHSVAPNDSYENMARNRRVDILIITTEQEANNNG
ncbi:OmpA family protein [Clostridium sp.]|uniref:OmpA/MotB family protein n=1 Tax=Clostridium sp. TaxID=1506 RepID=UPI002624218C|nr:OmpA family protein [Clostridium sp.]